MSEDNLFLLRTVNILTDEARLKLIGLLSLQAYSLAELSTLLGIKVLLVARHLRKLQRLGLIEVQPAQDGSASRYALNMQSFKQIKTSWYSSHTSLTAKGQVAIDEQTFEEWEREIIRHFFTGTRLTAIPAGRQKLEVIVKWFAQLFEVGVQYQEKEVNAIIQRHYYDYAFFKKDLVGRGIMRRENGIFWRVTTFQTGEPGRCLA